MNFGTISEEKCSEFFTTLNLPTNTGWWSKYPKRATEELLKMVTSTNANLSQEGSKLIFEEEITNNFGTCFLISIAVEDFPYKMPKVFVKSPKIKKKLHMWKDGSLCLMEPDTYNSGISILKIRNLACAWCFCYEAYLNTGEWPAAEH